MKIGGVNVEQLVATCGSPLQVYDEAAIETKLNEYQANFVSDYFETEVIYASKAFTCQAMLQLLQTFNTSLDVVSGGELFVAKAVKFDPNKIYFHGNNKTEDEIVDALHYGVKTMVVDNVYEIDTLIQIASKLNKQVHVLIRLNPKVEAHTHAYIMTATSDSKFGIDIDKESEIKAMIQKMEVSDNLIFDGFHSHIGSQIFAYDAFTVAIDKLVNFIAKIGYPVHTLNMGGGFGVVYTSEDKPAPVREVMKQLISALEASCIKHQVSIQKACIEPGRSVVAEAGYTLYRVGFTKQTENKQFLFVDGGMADNIRPALYDAKYSCDLVHRINEAKTEIYDIAGKCCESGDILIHDIALPKATSNDILVVYSTGAYGYSMASNYNRLNRLAVVFVKAGKARQVLRRETYEDQMRLDEIKEITMVEEEETC